MLPKLICIVGPTASGKTALGISLAKKYNGEIISADSRQIYRGMDIGTAKEKGEWRAIGGHEALVVGGVPHYGIDLVTPNEPYTVADFQSYANLVIANIVDRGKTPFIVGGTGLYVDAVIDNFIIPHVPPNPELRTKIEGLIREKGIQEVYLELLKFDPDAADFVSLQNSRRIIRALEVCLATGKPFSKQKKRGKRLYSALRIALDVPRDVLYATINARVEHQVRDGLVREIQHLLALYDPALPAFSGLGYDDIIKAIRDETTLPVALEHYKKRTRDYARRQMTWFRRDKHIKWVRSPEEADELVKKFLKA
ncbi:tRNA (adenosine(37)-N6)-dimethylallyltransferase MiaA [Candidatus Uhrbacteria bacterium]|nr:tRNA (adenosine(37)-N6)-dimethylallyltransferase MiaA [Candidatus Uhrbacteria bacterium]